MAKYRVHFAASAAIGVEIEVEAETPEAAETTAQKLWDEKDVTGCLWELIDVDDNARDGFAEAIGLTIPYATVSPDENGFEIVDAFAAEQVSAVTRTAKDLTALDKIRAIMGAVCVNSEPNAMGDALTEIAGILAGAKTENAHAILTTRERDTILAALRYWQRCGEFAGQDIHDIATGGEDGDISLNAEDIDELCLKLNR